MTVIAAACMAAAMLSGLAMLRGRVARNFLEAHGVPFLLI